MRLDSTHDSAFHFKLPRMNLYLQHTPMGFPPPLACMLSPLFMFHSSTHLNSGFILPQTHTLPPITLLPLLLPPLLAINLWYLNYQIPAPMFSFSMFDSMFKQLLLLYSSIIAITAMYPPHKL